MKIISLRDNIKNITNDDNLYLAELSLVLAKKLGCTYLTYMREDLVLNNKVYYTSRPDWGEILISKKYINDCPIYRIAFEAISRSEIGYYPLFWNDVEHTSDDELEVFEARHEHNIANGFGIAINLGNGIRESIVFGGCPDNYNFAKKVANKNFIIRTLFLVRRCIFFEKNNKKYLTSSYCKRLLKLLI